MFDSYVLIKLNSHSYKIQFILDFDSIRFSVTLQKSKENEFSLPNIIQTRVDSEEVRRKICFGPHSEKFLFGRDSWNTSSTK